MDSPSNARRYALIALVAAVGVVVLVVIGWAVDTRIHEDSVLRNVEVSGTPVGGQSRAELDATLDQIGSTDAARPVHLTTPAGDLDTTAGELGLRLDTDATSQAVLDAGRDGLVLARPFSWFGSLFTAHEVDAVHTVDPAVLDTALADLRAANLTSPTEPIVALVDGSMAAYPGEAGIALQTDQVADQLEAAIDGDDDPITIDLTTAPLAPTFTDAQAQAVADQANAMADTTLTVDIDGRTTTIDGDRLRSWVRGEPDASGTKLVLALDPELIDADLGKAIGSVGTAPTELSWTVDGNGSVSYTPGSPGTRCCGPDSAERIVDAVTHGRSTVSLDLTVAQPTHDAAWAESMGITTQVASFTTNHACCEGRVDNIQRMADQVRGTVVAPGETFSLNGLIGPRTAAKGYVAAGVIYGGKFEQDIGGGVSQFTTTLFNAAFFAGLDFNEYQAHTIYISRYPYGREATLSYPSPDLKFTNNTPYGILIWPSHTGTSITVSLYSTPWVSGEQTGQSTAPAGKCTKVTTQRTRTWLDGRTETDNVYATYQPAEGELC